MHSRIAGTGSYLPARVLTNDELAKRVATSDEWIATRTGIRQRHIAAPDERTSDLALNAARNALAAAAIAPADVDLIIVATTTPDVVFPSTACILQAKLGARGGPAFDVQAVCSGFVYALALADRMVAGGVARNALVIGAEIYSHILGSEHTWISRIEGRTPTVAIWPTLTDEELVRVGSENVAALRRILDGMTDVDLARVVAYRTSAGHPYESTVEDILLHVALHGAYHRGQLATLLRQGGAEPTATDYIVFIRDASPATRASIPAR